MKVIQGYKNEYLSSLGKHQSVWSVEGTSACPAITEFHACPPLVTDRGKPTKLFCLLYYINVFLEVTFFFFPWNTLIIGSIQVGKKTKTYKTSAFSWGFICLYVVHRCFSFPTSKCVKCFATFSAKCMDFLQHRCSESEHHCLTHVGFQYELTKCALVCSECQALAKPNENACILKSVRSYLVKWVKELK